MTITNFEQLIDTLKSSKEKKRMAVAAAADNHTLEAVLDAYNKGIITPILVGDENIIKSEIKALGGNPEEFEVYDEQDLLKCCDKAVTIVREGKADFLMKGLVDTKHILKAVANKETGLSTGSIMSHISMFEIPTYHKLVVVTDGGMLPYPDLMQKKCIIENAVATFKKIGYKKPKVGVLCCVEKVNPKMPETIEASELKEMNLKGEIADCVVEGPISYDCAMDKEAADFKGYKSEVAGDADILVAPNIHAGNIMGKMLSNTMRARMAGFIAGAKCPIVLTSRAATAEEKFLSICICAANA